MKGMIVYSFAWRRKGHSPCNLRLAVAAKRIIDTEEEPVLIVAQRTVAVVLSELGVQCQVIQKRPGYEGSEDVTGQATDEIFKDREIKEVIPVAQPFIQLTNCIRLVRKAGFKTSSFLKLAWRIGWIGFDRDSEQPWTRDPFRLTLYTIRQMLLGYRPPPELSE